MTAVVVIVFSLIVLRVCSFGFFYPLSSENRSNPYFLGDDWVPMSIEDAAKYLTPYEVCALQYGEGKQVCEVYFEHVDEELTSCHVFSEGIVNKCPNKFGALFRHSSTVWPHSRNMLHLIKLMTDRGSNTLFLIGDSMTQQHFFDIQCSLLRFQIPVKHRNIPHSDLYHRELLLRDPVSLQFLDPPFFQIHFIKYDSMSLEAWSALLDNMLGRNSPALAIVGKPVLIVNTGLHFSNEEQLRQGARAFLTPLVRLASSDRGLVVFRETSAQHFSSLHGMYETVGDTRGGGPREGVSIDIAHLPQDAAKMVFGGGRASEEEDMRRAQWPEFKVGCVPLDGWESFEQQNWRNRLIRTMLSDELDVKGHIQIAAFYRITAGRHDFHLHMYDCTHYCHGPMMWIPLTQNIYSIVNSTLSPIPI